METNLGAERNVILRTQDYFLGRSLAKAWALLAGFLFLFLIFAPWQQTSRATGKVLAYSPNDRAQNIDAAVDGRVQQWFVQEGSRVKEGDPIVEITDFDPGFLTNLKKEKDAVERRLVAAMEASRTAKLNLNRQKELFDQGLSSRRDFERANLDYVNLIAQEATASAELTRVDVRLSRQQNQMVLSPRTGTILKVRSGQGGVTVKAGDWLAVLVPDTHLRAVELWVDGNDLPLITEGRQVRVQFEGWPAIQFSGWPSVAIGTFGGSIANIDPFDNGKGQFRVLVVPDKLENWPKEMYLRQGVRATGWVILNQVSLIYEIWRQFNGFPATGNPGADSEDGKKISNDLGK
ncbi:MAG: HlyD family efflux transporter periplasmic adaptor subunit [Bdellovibrionales bacterium]|nr:HlyD family efflux transporter periplasmic adaptor subunit [Bdellovibrionales bacterium]